MSKLQDHAEGGRVERTIIEELVGPPDLIQDIVRRVLVEIRLLICITLLSRRSIGRLWTRRTSYLARQGTIVLPQLAFDLWVLVWVESSV